MDSGCGAPLEASNQFNPVQNSSSQGAKTPQYGLVSGSGSIIRTGTQERQDHANNLNLNLQTNLTSHFNVDPIPSVAYHNDTGMMEPCSLMDQEEIEQADLFSVHKVKKAFNPDEINDFIDE